MGHVAVITINRPKQLNALNSQVMIDVVSACQRLDEDDNCRAIVITGEGDKAFAAGADIKEMATQGYAQAYNQRMLGGWDGLKHVRKPLVAAVNGYALGGGCEVAMMCDIIIASEKASFGQPEVTLGVIPGMGGTQRLTWAVGKYRAMDLILTGRRISAVEAASMGLVSRVVAPERLMDEALGVAQQVAAFSRPVVAKAKECVGQALELPLAEGVQYEKREFWSCFALTDQKEGMGAFIEKRKPGFKDM